MITEPLEQVNTFASVWEEILTHNPAKPNN